VVSIFFFQGYVGFGDGLVEKGKPVQTSPLSPALEKLLLPSNKNTGILPERDCLSAEHGRTQIPAIPGPAAEELRPQ